jgi:hypothetical protein
MAILARVPIPRFENRQYGENVLSQGAYDGSNLPLENLHQRGHANLRPTLVLEKPQKIAGRHLAHDGGLPHSWSSATNCAIHDLAPAR